MSLGSMKIGAFGHLISVRVVPDSTATPAYRRRHRAAAKFSDGGSDVLVIRGNWRKAKRILAQWKRSKRGTLKANVFVCPAAPVSFIKVGFNISPQGVEVAQEN
jgi:hypothetical protein